MANDASQKPRMRASHTKSRRACTTCRTRRIRCDETKPTCKNCEKAGRVCEGYQVQFREATVKSAAPARKASVSSSTSPTPNTNTITASSSQSSILRQPNRHAPIPQAELQVLEYFTKKTLPLLGYFYPSDLWNRTLPRLIHEDDLFRLCAMAIGSRHARIDRMGWHCIPDGPPGDSSPPYTNCFGLTQYNKAIMSLRRQLLTSSLDTTAVVVGCLLFLTFEALHGRQSEMAMHYRSGLQLIKTTQDQYLSGESADTFVFFARFGFISALCVGPQAPALTAFPNLKFLLPKLDGLSRLRAEMHIITTDMSETGQRARLGDIDFAEVLRRRAEMMERVNALYDKIDAYQNETTLPLEYAQCSVLKAEWELTNLIVRIDFSMGQSYYDLCHENFRRVLDNVREALDIIRTVSEDRPAFSVDTGMIGTLYYTACLCRHPRLRRHAVEMMSACPRVEGLWDAEEAAEAARQVIRYEEEGVEAEYEDDVPSLIREERRAHHRFITKGQMSNGWLPTVELLVKSDPTVPRFESKVLPIHSKAGVVGKFGSESPKQTSLTLQNI